MKKIVFPRRKAFRSNSYTIFNSKFYLNDLELKLYGKSKEIASYVDKTIIGMEFRSKEVQLFEDLVPIYNIYHKNYNYSFRFPVDDVDMTILLIFAGGLTKEIESLEIEFVLIVE